MSSSKIVELIQSSLSKEELSFLNEINQIQDSELRQAQLRGFFHNQEVFDKVKSIADPAWLSYEIFIKGKTYEF
jgi:hypothetical protein